MKCLLVASLIFTIVPAVAQQITIDITQSVTENYPLSGPDPTVHQVGSISTTHSPVNVTVTIFDPWIDLYTGTGNDGDNDCSNKHVHSLGPIQISSSSTPLKVCVLALPFNVDTNLNDLGTYFTFITATPPAFVTDLLPASAALQYFVFPTGSLSNDAANPTDVSGGRSTVTVTESSSSAIRAGSSNTPRIAYVSGNSWLTEVDDCVGVQNSTCTVNISGNPGAPGLLSGNPYWAKVHFSDNAGNATEFDVRYTPPYIPLAITSSAIFQITARVPFTATLTTSGGAGGNQWSAGGLPNGLQLSNNGVLSGTVSVIGSAQVQVTVRDSAGNQASQTITIAVTAGARDRVGVFRKLSGLWAVDDNGNQQYDGPPSDPTGYFGLPGDIPVVGDWDGSGKTKVGVFRQGVWHLDLSGTGQYNPATDRTGSFGLPGDIPVVGDWDGSGKTKVGVFRNGEWHLDLSGTAQYNPATDRTGSFGLPGDIPVVGDWDGSGKTKVGVFRNGEWHLDLSGTAQYNPLTDRAGSFGVLNDVPVVGDWNGSGQTKVGVFRNGEWHLDLSGTAQYNSLTDRTGFFGVPGDTPVVGDWNGSRQTKVGVFRNAGWHLDLSGTAQYNPATDLTGYFGLPNDVPVVGKWAP